ncbi:hypothetical protein [uncultured Croceitalea sp.]|uniref:hypothetical protein n=1 Tax=uncultured Croceitalea sp. TaxID=1798908 RepID=UPI00374FA807
MKRRQNSFQSRKGKQNIFRSVSAGRNNLIAYLLIDFLFFLSHYPSFIAEVFLRKKFGERYFTLMTAIFIFATMITLFIIAGEQGPRFFGYTWPLFAMFFLVVSIKHRLEIIKYGTTYNFDRFSYSDGHILPFWWDYIGKEYYGVTITRYRVHVFLEPAIPVVIGLFLSVIPFTRAIGVLIFTSGIFFGIRNFIKAHIARGHILDIIDEQIAMEAKHDVLVEQKPITETKGISFPIELPKSKALRQQLSDSMDNENPLDIWDNELEFA